MLNKYVLENYKKNDNQTLDDNNNLEEQIKFMKKHSKINWRS